MTREEAIQHLENMKWLKGYSNTTVDGVSLDKIIDDIIVLLEAQEPRLVVKEDFAHADECGYITAWCEASNGLFAECITIGALEEKDFRYWTSRPTDEQRKAVKWNDN